MYFKKLEPEFYDLLFNYSQESSKTNRKTKTNQNRTERDSAKQVSEERPNLDATSSASSWMLVTRGANGASVATTDRNASELSAGRGLRDQGPFCGPWVPNLAPATTKRDSFLEIPPCFLVPVHSHTAHLW